MAGSEEPVVEVLAHSGLLRKPGLDDINKGRNHNNRGKNRDGGM